MKSKKNIVIGVLVIVILLVGGIFTYNILRDKNKLNALEKRWINTNINTVQNINVVNNVNLFGNMGKGVFYEFIDDIAKDLRLEFNPVTYNYKENVSGITLGIKNTYNDNDMVFYTDHYVLVSKKDEVFGRISDFASKKIGVINDDLSYVSNYLKTVKNLTLKGYQNEEELLKDFNDSNEIEYILVPLTIYLDEILKNDYYIVNHLSDINLYYVISSGDTEDAKTLYNIMRKYYQKWKENLDSYFKKEEFNLFKDALDITDTEVDAIRSVSYNYGFINNSPYEVIMSGNYGGIVAIYLDSFSKFSEVDFKYTKYRNLNSFMKSLNKEEIDLYFDYYNLQDKYYTSDSKILVVYSILANKSNEIVVNSLNSLKNKTVYVDKNSFLASYLKNIEGINIKTYNGEAGLKKLNKKDEIIVIDKNVFNLYSSSRLSNYSERYSGTINETYNFKVRTNSAFYKLFNKYAMSLDNNEMIYKGLHSHSLTVKTGNVLALIAKYILITIAVVGVIFIIFYKSNNKIKIAKKIKKDNKLKFIDQLTSLKNRNYLNEYINNWNNNKIYPQTMVIIDLNNIQFINDTLGYEEGDKQIKAAANILIKTQLDNSDIMRTDGNEFLVYLVGYTQKQITTYIHKLSKEFKKLPFEYGAEFGYSMINDELKTIEDAIIEATEDMRKQKKKSKEE